jgi:hypothetical protein
MRDEVDVRLISILISVRVRMCMLLKIMYG